jgi:hypothetical protein
MSLDPLYSVHPKTRRFVSRCTASFGKRSAGTVVFIGDMTTCKTPKGSTILDRYFYGLRSQRDE